MFCYQHIPQIARASSRLVNRKLMSGRLNYQIANSCRETQRGTMDRYDESYSSLCCNRGPTRIDGGEGEEEGPEVCCNLAFRRHAQTFSSVSCSAAL